MKNVGGTDKGLRLIVGVILILIGLFAHVAAGLRIVAFIVAAVALFTGIFGF